MTYPIPTVSAVAATPITNDAPPPLARADVSSPPTTAAEAAGSRGSNPPDDPRWLHITPVEGVEPVDGWELHHFTDFSHDCGEWTEYVARGADRDIKLHLSRWSFTPTQARFAWLVRAGFPNGVQRPGGCITPIHNSDIDGAIAGSLAA